MACFIFPPHFPGWTLTNQHLEKPPAPRKARVFFHKNLPLIGSKQNVSERFDLLPKLRPLNTIRILESFIAFPEWQEIPGQGDMTRHNPWNEHNPHPPDNEARP